MSRLNLPVLVHLSTLGDVEGVQRVLAMDEGVDVNSQDDEGNTGLMAAIMLKEFSLPTAPVFAPVFGPNRKWKVSMKQKFKIAKFLLQQPGMDINCVNNDGNTALHVCAAYGNIEGLGILLGHPGRNINAKNSRGLTPLMMAVCYGNEEFVKDLLKTKEVSLEDRNVGANKENIPKKEKVTKDSEAAKVRNKKGKKKKKMPIEIDGRSILAECLPGGTGGGEVGDGNVMPMVGPQAIPEPQKQVDEANGENIQIEKKVTSELEAEKIKICWNCHAPKETTKLFKCKGCHKALWGEVPEKGLGEARGVLCNRHGEEKGKDISLSVQPCKKTKVFSLHLCVVVKYIV